MKTKLNLSQLLIPILLALALAVAGCSSGGDVPEEVANEILSIVRWNLTYATDENLNGYMWTIHPDAPAYANTRSLMRTAMDDFDLTYQLLDSELISFSGDTARVRVIQLTRSNGPEPNFRDNQLEAVHTLKLGDDGKWKIYSSSFSDIEYLEP